MKKIFFFAAIAALALTACKKSETVSVSNDRAEITAVGFNKVMTKGYTGWDTDQTYFEEVTNPESPGTAVDRTMKLSVYEQNVGDLFTDVTYAKGDDGNWHAQPNPIYYPLGGNTFDFLAYSVGKETPKSNYVGVWDGAKKVSLQVTDAFFQDDILYAAASNTSQIEATPMTFSHAQAWINMKLNLTKESSPSVVFKVNSITWKNVKSQGKLYIEYATPVKATWDFFGIDSNEVEMDDPHHILNTALASPAGEPLVDGVPSKLNMLLPAQSGATGFVINYTVGGKTFDYEYTLVSGSPAEPTPATWEMGHKYVYNVHITVKEITVNPNVVEFEVETGSDIAL